MHVRSPILHSHIEQQTANHETESGFQIFTSHRDSVKRYNAMRAARYHGQRDLRVDEVEVPQIKEGQALIEIEWCGICGSDLHEYLVGKLNFDRRTRKHI